MNAPSSMPASLYNVESAIVELHLLRDEAEHEGDSQAVAVIDEQITEWAKAELRKVDGVASWIRECEARAQVAKEEADRLRDRAKEWQAKADRVREAALRAMQDHGIKRPLQGTHSTLRLQGNGGLQKLEVFDIEALPDEYKAVVVKIPADMWRELQSYIQKKPSFPVLAFSVEACTDNIRMDLKQQVICPECNGRPGNIHYTDEETGCSDDLKPCPRCKGAGTIPATIPGAKLLPRGQRLVVE
jgi:hypothetical protein